MSQEPVLAERFVDEKLGLHWQVDDSPDSFARLQRHIGEKTNFRAYFERALADSAIAGLPEGHVVVDLGAGVGWTSALLAKKPAVGHVYVVEPSQNRLARARAVARHFGAPEDRLTFVDGSFVDPKVPVKADLIVLCASIHHCYDGDMAALFANLRDMLNQGGTLLLANEHYVSPFWTVRRVVSWLRAKLTGRKVWWGPGKWRTPEPFSGEHWRTREELEALFRREGFAFRIQTFDGDLCGEKSGIGLWGWHYYYAVLTRQAA